MKIKRWFRIASLEIKRAKHGRKTKNYNKVYNNKLTKEIEDLGGPVFTTKYLWSMKNEFRHRHIAWCLLRGRQLEQIEKPAIDNAPNMDKINKYMEEYRERLEALRVAA